MQTSASNETAISQGRMRLPGLGGLREQGRERMRARGHEWERTLRRNRLRLALLGLVVLVFALAFLLVGVRLDKPAFFAYSMKIRLPKVAAMLVAAVGIGGATLVFQSIIRNTVVTPCLLGMNSLYTLVHTFMAFVMGASTFAAMNANVSFLLDLAVMSVVAMVVYGLLFRATRYNVLYILLVGTVLASLFGSIQSTLVRVMDPNEYETLLATLVPSFSNMNVQVVALAAALLVAVGIAFRRDLALLDVIGLGKDQAINLGVDYNRTIRRLLLLVTLCIAIATALVGPISFLGLIVANLSRQLLRTYRHSQLIAGSVLMGMLVLFAGETLTERVFHYLIPVSVFVSVGGGLYFLWLLLRTKQA